MIAPADKQELRIWYTRESEGRFRTEEIVGQYYGADITFTNRKTEDRFPDEPNVEIHTSRVTVPSDCRMNRVPFEKYQELRRESLEKRRR